MKSIVVDLCLNKWRNKSMEKRNMVQINIEKILNIRLNLLIKELKFTTT